MEGRVLWHNPDAKKCPYCTFTEPCTRCYRSKNDGVAHLRAHILAGHHKFVAAYGAQAGMHAENAAWEIARRARPPPAWPGPVRVGGAVTAEGGAPAPLTFFEMFSGIGAARHAARSLGWRSVGFCEISRDSVAEYRANFDTDGEFFWPNARTLDTADVPPVDVVVAGFPCQTFSQQGNRRGFEDTRGTLFREVARLVRDKAPAAFVLENVGGLLTHDGGRTFQTILGVLGRTVNGQAPLEGWEGCAGYDVFWAVLNSKDYGVAQNRPRVYIVGFRPGAMRDDFGWPAPRGGRPVLRDILEPDDQVDPKLFVDPAWFAEHYALEDGAAAAGGAGTNGIATFARRMVELRGEGARPVVKDLDTRRFAVERGGDGLTRIVQRSRSLEVGGESAAGAPVMDMRKSDRAVLEDGVAPTLDTGAEQSIIVVGRRKTFKSMVAVGAEGISPVMRTEGDRSIIVVGRRKEFRSTVAVGEEGISPTVNTEVGWPGPGILVVARKKSYKSFTAVDEKGLHPTVTTWTAQTDSEGSIIWPRMRWLTARECARLQGFPEDHKILPPRRDACFRFGNACTVPVLKAIEESVQAALGRGPTAR